MKNYTANLHSFEKSFIKKICERCVIYFRPVRKQVRGCVLGRSTRDTTLGECDSSVMKMSDEEQDIDDTLEEDDGELIDWQLPLCFMKKRHKEKIDGIACLPQSWRMKERVCNSAGHHIGLAYPLAFSCSLNS